MIENGIHLAIVGNLAYDQIITQQESRRVISGAAYDAAVAASTVAEEGFVGVVARVGEDYEEGIAALRKRGIDVEGVAVISGGETAVFTISNHEDNTRDFASEMGVAGEVDTALFPEPYKNAKHVHLATDHPEKYLQWIPHLRTVLPQDATISADASDFYLEEAIEPMKEALDAVDFVFMNEMEFAAIKTAFPDYELKKPTIVKKGKEGASYIDMQEGIEITVRAPTVEVIDTTSAGDTLAGVYLVKRLQGASIQEALESGVNTAAKTVTDFGVEHLNPLS